MSTFSLWMTSSRFRTALLVGTAAAVACMWIGWAGLHPVAVQAAAPNVSVVAGALDAPMDLPAIDIAATAEADLFTSSRNAPPERYRLPAEIAEKTAILTSAPIEAAKPVVLGTATSADGSSFATCQFQSDRLLMVRVGDHVGGYVVKAIDRGRVTFTGPDGKQLEVLAPKAGS